MNPFFSDIYVEMIQLEREKEIQYILDKSRLLKEAKILNTPWPRINLKKILPIFYREEVQQAVAAPASLQNNIDCNESGNEYQCQPC